MQSQRGGAGNLKGSEGLPEKSFPETWRLLRESVEPTLSESRVAPGAVLGVWRRSEPRTPRFAFAGRVRAETDSPAVRVDTVFDLASLTKIVGSATLLARLVERGEVRWSDPVQAFFPEYAYSTVTLEHLASHTAGYAAWAPFWQKLLAEGGRGNPTILRSIPVMQRQARVRDEVLASVPEVQPGVRALYSDLSFLLLGFCLERVTGLPLDQALQRRVFEPWGLEGLSFRRIEEKEWQDSEVAATEQCPWRGRVLQGEVHDDNCWAMGGYGGHAGLFGRAEDLLLFARRWLEGAISRPVRQVAWTRVASPSGCERTPGWDTPSGPKPASGRGFGPGSVGHLGFTGTSLWIDPVRECAVVLLTNRVHPSRENIRIREFRPRIHDVLLQELSSFR
jgi:CubicO group peptidase (beta-lactamase class C family)